MMKENSIMPVSSIESCKSRYLVFFFFALLTVVVVSCSVQKKMLLVGGPYYYEPMDVMTLPKIYSEMLTKEDTAKLAKEGQSYGEVYYDDQGRMISYTQINRGSKILQIEIEYYKKDHFQSHWTSWNMIGENVVSESITCYRWSGVYSPDKIMFVAKYIEDGEVEHVRMFGPIGPFKNISLEEFEKFKCAEL